MRTIMMMLYIGYPSSCILWADWKWILCYQSRIAYRQMTFQWLTRLSRPGTIWHNCFFYNWGQLNIRSSVTVYFICIEKHHFSSSRHYNHIWHHNTFLLNICDSLLSFSSAVMSIDNQSKQLMETIPIKDNIFILRRPPEYILTLLVFHRISYIS